MLGRIFVAVVKFYRVVFSGKRPCCRYLPTCSSYTIEAIEKYGTLKGGFLALKRILRCCPGLRKYANCGYDPVP